MKGKGKNRADILSSLTDKFGEKHPEVGVFVKPSYTRVIGRVWPYFILTIPAVR
ncbi:hypothetical protein LR021_04015 [Candidatus Bipolaricaulota bacterium]|nr:hypothetical protein [Candidatus Bipolaricaulota bacterium]